MKFTHTLTLIASATLFLTACGQDSGQTAVAVKANTNPLLAYVPTDTPYVFAALEPAPEEVTDAYLSRFQPIIDVLSKQATKFKTDFESGGYAGNEMATLAAAVLDELGGNISTDGLERLGISLQAHQVFYGMGVFPVIRFELSDAQALQDAIARIETKMEFNLPVRQWQGQAFWRFSENDARTGLYIAILDRQLAISLFPANAEAALLPAFLGQDMPAQSMASTNALAVLNSQKGYTGYGSGILDLQVLANELLLPESATNTYLGADAHINLESFDAICREEVREIITHTPRITAGITKLSNTEIALRYQLDVESTLAGTLAGLVSNTPPAASGEQLLTASLALKIGKLRGFLLDKANSFVAAPFQCKLFDELNHGAEQLAQQLNIPMPPMVNNLMGVRVSVDDFDWDTSQPQGKGLVAIHVDKPEMFVGMASMVVPGFDELDLANQSEPVRIPTSLLYMRDIDVFALMTDDAIGASVGEQGRDRLASFMRDDSDNNGVFFSVSYDSDLYMKRHPHVLDQLGGHGTDDKTDKDFEREFSAALKKSTTSLLGTTRWEMHFTHDGLIIDNSMTFK